MWKTPGIIGILSLRKCRHPILQTHLRLRLLLLCQQQSYVLSSHYSLESVDAVEEVDCDPDSGLQLPNWSSNKSNSHSSNWHTSTHNSYKLHCIGRSSNLRYKNQMTRSIGKTNKIELVNLENYTSWDVKMVIYPFTNCLHDYHQWPAQTCLCFATGYKEIWGDKISFFSLFCYKLLFHTWIVPFLY